jgi:ribosome maturation factor RimP
MQDRSTLPSRLTEELCRLAAAESCELLEIERQGSVLRFVLDRPDGVTHEHCATFSRQASALLDLEDFGERRYVLEVSSPGLDRKLYGETDYERFQGRLARLTFRDAELRRRTVVATLEEVDPDQRSVTLREQETHEEIRVPLSSIEGARLEIEL